MHMQASLLASAALTTEVVVLKQDLEGSRKELGLAKRQLEEREGGGMGGGGAERAPASREKTREFGA